MSDNNQNNNGTPSGETPNANAGTPNDGTGGDPSIEKLVSQRVAEALAPIKEKLDSAYSARDEANAKLAKLELERKEADLKRLEEEGKHLEAANRRLAEEQARSKALEEQNINLSRDVNVRGVLAGYAFKNERAAEIAFKEVVGQLTRNEQGIWVHKSGVSVKDFMEAFSKDEEQSFLFKPKASSGNGSSNTNSNTAESTGKKSLFKMSQAEVLKLAGEGKL